MTQQRLHSSPKAKATPVRRRSRLNSAEDVFSEAIYKERVRKSQALIRGWLARKGFCLNGIKLPLKPGCIGPGSFLPLVESDVLDIKIEWLVGGEYRTFENDDDFQDAFVKAGNPKLTRSACVALKGWQQKKYLELLAEVSVDHYVFPHGCVQAANIEEPLPWTICVGVERSCSGSDGVLFVEFPEKQAVVVKAPGKIASEMLGTMVCKKLGICCPQMRLVKRRSKEGREIFSSLVTADRKRPPRDRTVSEMLNKKPAFLVIEYLKAYELADLGVKRPLERWGAQVLGLPEGLSDQGRSVLHDFGSLIAFDMFVNNYDRLPCIWMNQGNPGNILFDASEHSVISIDNMMTCIQSPGSDSIGLKLYSEYLAHVRATCEAVARNPEVEHPDFRRVRQLLCEGCPDGHGWPGLGLDIGPEGTLAVQHGFLQTVQTLLYGPDGTESGISRLWLEEQSRLLFEAIVDHEQPAGVLESTPECTCGFECININFMDDVITIYAEALKEARSEKQTSVRGEESQRQSELPPALVMLKGSGSRGGSDDVFVCSTGEGQVSIAACKERAAQFMNRLRQVSRQRKVWEDVVEKCNEQLRQKRRRRHRQRAALRHCPKRTFSLERLLAKNRKTWPSEVKEDPANREKWLSEVDFEKSFGMAPDNFGKMKLWRRCALKKARGLF